MVPEQSRRSPVYLGNGVTNSFPFDFKVFAATELQVVKADVTGTETTLVKDTNYSVSLNPDQESNPGGSITYPLAGAKLQTGEKLVIVGDLDVEQGTDITNGGGFKPQVLEDAIDRVVMILQQVFTEQARRVGLAVTDPSTASLTLPSPVANLLLGWKSDASRLENKAIAPTSGSIVTAFINTLLAASDASTARDILGVTNTSNPYIDYDADPTGATSSSAALQAAIDDPATRAILLPAGDFLITTPLILRDGITIRGMGREATRLVKSNYNGACILGVDTDSVAIEDLSIVGPGRAVGGGNANKGIDLHVSVQEINKSVVLRNITVRDFNDVGVYMGSCSYATWQSVRVTDIGYCAIWIDGGDGHNLTACSTQYSLIGFYINLTAGYGPTTVALQACYAEQAGRGFWFNGAVSCTALGCGVEAAIAWDATHNGTNWTISGGESVSLIGCLSRNDTVGVALPITSPHILVDASAKQVLIDGFRMNNHGTFAAPTYELDAQNATSVTLGRHNFTGGKIRSNGKISTIDVTVVP